MSSENGFDSAVGIFWDIDNCGVPNNGNVDDPAAAAARHVRDFASKYGKIHTFAAFGDFDRLPAEAQRSLQQLGASTLDLSSARREATDKAIIVELCFFAVDSKPPATVILITGDRDYSDALQRLKQHQYRVLVFSMPGCNRDSLIFASEERGLFDWPSLATLGEARPLAPVPAGLQRRDESFGSLGRPQSASSSGSNSSGQVPSGPSRQPLPGSGRQPPPPSSGPSNWMGSAGRGQSPGGAKSGPMSWQALKGSPLGRRPFQDFLASSPNGIDGGTVNKWLTSHVGGIDAFGYTTFKDLMRAAETAGLCRLGGTKSLYVYPPPPSRAPSDSSAADPVHELQRLLTLDNEDGSSEAPPPPPQYPSRSASGPLLGRPPSGPAEPHIPGWLIAKIRSEFWNGRREEVTQPYTRLVQWLNRESSERE